MTQIFPVVVPCPECGEKSSRRAVMTTSKPCRPGLRATLRGVAMFIVGALTVAHRREHEENLLRGYLEALAGYGGPRISFADAWASEAR